MQITITDSPGCSRILFTYRTNGIAGCISTPSRIHSEWVSAMYANSITSNNLSFFRVMKCSCMLLWGTQYWYHLDPKSIKLLATLLCVAQDCQSPNSLEVLLKLGKNHFLLTFIRIEEFIFYLKLFIDTVRLDQVVIDDCKTLIDDFQLSLSLFNKFNELWKNINFKDRFLNKDLEVKMKNFAWLIFITSKGMKK